MPCINWEMAASAEAAAWALAESSSWRSLDMGTKQAGETLLSRGTGRCQTRPQEPLPASRWWGILPLSSCSDPSCHDLTLSP